MRALILAFVFLSPPGFAQTSGDATRGNIPPGTSQDGSRPADGAIKGGSTIAPGERAGVPDQAPSATKSERLARCDELTGVLREQCLDKERSAAGGSAVPPRPRNKEAPVERQEELKRSAD
jgi:hypothetical protein